MKVMKRILWVSLIKFPELCKALNESVPSHCGWLHSSAEQLLKYDANISLGVIVYSYGLKYECYHINGRTYYMIPSPSMGKVHKGQIEACRKAINDFKPDIIHIHGTEYSLAKAVTIANASSVPILVNIQGLATPYTRYADGMLSIKDQLFNFTPLDFYRGTFIWNAKCSFAKRAECEEFVLRHVNYVVGRTQWDYDHSLTINPHIQYFFMNETLRNSFYDDSKWCLENCCRHSIFVSNSGSPLKGAHQVLKALPIILKYYPDVVVKFCGSNVLCKDFKSMLHMQGYHLYLRRLVEKLKLEKHVLFLGTLSENEMKSEFLKANVYVLPSAIENSPNSLCEAQILGVPAIASYAGGIPDLVEHGKTGFLYRYEEFEMLAQIIIRVLETNNLETLSTQEREMAMNRHNRENNARRLSNVYNQILKNQ